MPRILVVCAGNTCRSPMTVGFLRSLLGPGSEVQSAGLEITNGLPPTKAAVQAMAARGIDISRHWSRTIESIRLRDFDVLIALTPEIARELGALRDSSQEVLDLNVLDPYNKGQMAYDSAATDIESQLTTALEKLKRTTQ